MAHSKYRNKIHGLKNYFRFCCKALYFDVTHNVVYWINMKKRNLNITNGWKDLKLLSAFIISKLWIYHSHSGFCEAAPSEDNYTSSKIYLSLMFLYLNNEHVCEMMQHTKITILKFGIHKRSELIIR